MGSPPRAGLVPSAPSPPALRVYHVQLDITSILSPASAQSVHVTHASSLMPHRVRMPANLVDQPARVIRFVKVANLLFLQSSILLPTTIIHLLLFVFLTGPQSVLQWLPLHPHRGQRHSHLRLQFPWVCGNSDERTELYLQRDQIFPPVQH